MGSGGDVPVLKRRWFWAVCAVVVGAVAAAATMWIPKSADPLHGEVSIDLAPETFVLGEDGNETLSAKVTNDTGRKLTDVDLRFTVDKPGGDYPPVRFGHEMFDPECGIEDPGVEPECVKAERIAKSQSCEVDDPGGEARAAVVCDGDIPEGTSQYGFGYSIGHLPSYEELSGLVDYPDLKIRASARTGEATVGTASRRLNIDLPPGYGRMTVDDLPQGMDVDEPASRRHEWSFTVTNDTDTDVTDAKIAVEANSGIDIVEIDTTRDGCESGSDIGRAQSEIECSGVDIPANEDLTVTMGMNVDDGGSERLDKSCPPQSSEVDECRAERGEAFLIVEVLRDGVFAYAEHDVSLDVGD